VPELPHAHGGNESGGAQVTTLRESLSQPAESTVRTITALVQRCKLQQSQFGAFIVGTLQDASGSASFILDKPDVGMTEATLQGRTINVEVATIKSYKGEQRLKFSQSALALQQGPEATQATPAAGSIPASYSAQHGPVPAAGTPSLEDCLRLIEQAGPRIRATLTPFGDPHHYVEAEAVARTTAGGALLSTLLIAYTNGKITLPQGESDDIPF
jgi:hypothetical protein